MLCPMCITWIGETRVAKTISQNRAYRGRVISWNPTIKCNPSICTLSAAVSSQAVTLELQLAIFKPGCHEISRICTYPTYVYFRTTLVQMHFVIHFIDSQHHIINMISTLSIHTCTSDVRTVSIGWEQAISLDLSTRLWLFSASFSHPHIAHD
jgi:hypothetical protein